MCIPVWACIHLLKFVWKVAVAFDDQYVAFLWTKKQILSVKFERFCFVACSRKLREKVEWWLAARYVVCKNSTPPSIQDKKREVTHSIQFWKGPLHPVAIRTFFLTYHGEVEDILVSWNYVLKNNWIFRKRRRDTSVFRRAAKTQIVLELFEK